MSTKDVTDVHTESKQENSVAVVILAVLSVVELAFGFGNNIATLTIIGGISLALTFATAAIVSELRKLRG